MVAMLTVVLHQKPKKKKLKNERTNTDKELKSISTQTTRDVSQIDFILFYFIRAAYSFITFHFFYVSHSEIF